MRHSGGLPVDGRHERVPAGGGRQDGRLYTPGTEVRTGKKNKYIVLIATGLRDLKYLFQSIIMVQRSGQLDIKIETKTGGAPPQLT